MPRPPHGAHAAVIDRRAALRLGSALLAGAAVLSAAKAVRAESDDGPIAARTAVISAPPADAPAKVVAVQAAPQTTPQTAPQTAPQAAPMTTQQQIDAYLAAGAASDRPTPRDGLLTGLGGAGDPYGPDEIGEAREGQGADRRMHGEVGAMLGAGGTRGVWGVTTMPVGENSQVTIGFSQIKGRGVLGYGGGPYGYGGYGGHGGDGRYAAPYSDDTRTTLSGSFLWTPGGGAATGTK